MTDNEIINALACCIKETSDCGNCPLYVPADADCINISKAGALDLINRQKAEIEQWREEANIYQNLWCEAEKDTQATKVEAVKEFANEIKKHFFQTELIEYLDSFVEEVEMGLRK